MTRPVRSHSWHKFALLACASLLTTTVAVAQEAAPKWITFTPKVAKLTVELPMEPEENREEMATEAGPAVTYAWSVAGEGQSYFVSYSEMPAAVADADPKAVLEGARDGAVNNIKGTLETQNPVSLKDVPGIDFVTKVNDTMRVHQRIFLSGRILYQMLVITETGEFMTDEMNRFFSSFKLLAAAAPAKKAPETKKASDAKKKPKK